MFSYTDAKIFSISWSWHGWFLSEGHFSPRSSPFPTHFGYKPNAGGGRFSRKNSPDALQNLSCFLRKILSHNFAKLEGVCKIIRSLNRGGGGFARDFFWFCINRTYANNSLAFQERMCFWQFSNQAKKIRDKNNFLFVLRNAKRTNRSCGGDCGFDISISGFVRPKHILLHHEPKKWYCNLLFQYEKSLGIYPLVCWFVPKNYLAPSNTRAFP